MFSVSRKISLHLGLTSGKISVKSPRFARWYAIPQSAMYFWIVMEGSWKVRRKYLETAMKKSKNKYDFAEYDVIRVIIVIIAGTARLAEQRRVTAPRRGTRRTETAAPRPVSCTRACGGDQRRARGGSRGRVGRVGPSN